MRNFSAKTISNISKKNFKGCMLVRFVGNNYTKIDIVQIYTCKCICIFKFDIIILLQTNANITINCSDLKSF